MQPLNDIPITKDLVLIGGGHAHAMALKMLAMRDVPGVRITLISDSCLTPYSGMLPGLIAGHYTEKEIHIDLSRLCRALGVRFIEDTVTALDLDAQYVSCLNHPDFHYDILSIDTGSSPGIEHIPGAKNYTQGVKPVAQFLNYWDALQERLSQVTLQQGMRSSVCHIALVGAGASGVEVALAMQYALAHQLPAPRMKNIQFHVLSATQEILSGHNPAVRKRYRAVLDARNISVHQNFRVSRVAQGALFDESDAHQPKYLKADEIIWAISASAPAWPKLSGLQCSGTGFIEVNACLQSVSHPRVFAAGDIANVLSHPRPKAGVFAVRQGKPLAENLIRALEGRALNAFTPQKTFLSLLSTGDKYAIASKGNMYLAGKWLWRWKDSIDRRFMTALNTFGAAHTTVNAATDDSDITVSMRCGGCGAKVGQPILERVIKQIDVSLSGGDDAAVFSVPENKVVVQSVDAFRRFIDDDYLFGQIAANHALGDIFAMGAQPHSAQVIVTLPFASEEKVEQQLLHLMLGASKVFQAANMPIIGGHTAEGRELSLGFAVNGLAEQNTLLTKSGLQSGDVLILTKPLGTGALFAADMRGQAQGVWVKEGIKAMLHSNQQASEVLFKYGVKACTDVTGFGLAGHLMEMLQPVSCRARLHLEALPLLEGVVDVMERGFFSSLHEQNKQIDAKMQAFIDCSFQGRTFQEGRSQEGTSQEHISILKEIVFDPQTAGGLLAGVPANNADACLDALKALSYSHACVIGEVL